MAVRERQQARGERATGISCLGRWGYPLRPAVAGAPTLFGWPTR